MTTHRSFGSKIEASNSVFRSSTETRLALYAGIFRELPVGIVILHLEDPRDVRTFKILDLNPAAEMMDCSSGNLRGRTLADFPRLLGTAFPARCQEVFRARERRDLGEISCGDEHIREGTYSIQIFPLPDKFLGVSLEDVTDRKRVETDRREREGRILSVVEGVQEYAIFHLDPLGHVTTWTAGAERVKGYRAEEVIGKHFSIFYPGEDVAGGKPERTLAEAVRHGQTEDEGWRVRKDGSRFWANVVVTALRGSEGTLQGFAKLTRDITKWREKEQALTRAKALLERRIERRAAVLARVNQELRTEIAVRKVVEEQHKISLEQLRALAARLQSVREEERTSIAREIHDELGQACTAIKMDLALIGRKVTRRQAPIRAKVDSAIHLADEMIRTLRRIASDLRPRTLDDLGLAAALEWQAQEFEHHTGIRCSVTLPQEPIVLDWERSTAIFRIFQESLTNVARHAHATRVETRLDKDLTQITLQVHDDGRGFDPAEVKTRPSLGLVGMQERALLLKGELTVESFREAGTTITLRVPLPPPPCPRTQDESSDS
jgi:PAS domain S-box-containing protein